jgi:hypothetical protein
MGDTNASKMLNSSGLHRIVRGFRREFVVRSKPERTVSMKLQFYDRARFTSASGLVILARIAVWQEQSMLQLMIDSKRRLAYSGSLYANSLLRLKCLQRGS